MCAVLCKGSSTGEVCVFACSETGAKLKTTLKEHEGKVQLFLVVR